MPLFDSLKRDKKRYEALLHNMYVRCPQGYGSDKKRILEKKQTAQTGLPDSTGVRYFVFIENTTV